MGRHTLDNHFAGGEHSEVDAGRRRPRVRQFLKFWPGAILFWALIVLIAYYRVHKPFAWSNLLALIQIVLELIAWGGTLSLAHALGRIWINDHHFKKTRTRFSLRVGLGLGLMGMGMLLLGVGGLYESWLAWTVLIVGQIPSLPAFLRDLRASAPALPGTLFQRACALGLLGFTALVFLQALSPPTGYDALVYHLTGPKLYVQAHTLVHDIDVPHLGFPQAGEMLFVWGLLLDGPQIAQLLHLGFMLLSVALFGDLVERVAPPQTYLASLLLLGTPSLLQLAGQAYVEWIPIFGGLAALVVIEEGLGQAQDPDQSEHGLLNRGHIPFRLLILAAFFTALAFSSKYTALGLIAGLGIALLYSSRSIRSAVLAAVAFVAFSGPYMLKNFWLTGNPVYPFFFGGKYWDALRASWYSRFGTGLTPEQALRAPWDFTIGGVEGGAVAGYPSYGATIGPLFLALLPLFLLAFHPRAGAGRKTIIRVAWVVLAGYAVWVFQAASSALLVQSRLLFPIWPFFLMIIVRGFDRMNSVNAIGASVSVVFKGLVLFVIALTFFNQVLTFQRHSPVPYLLGLETKKQNLRARLGQYFLAIEKVNELPNYARVRFLWEPRTYYCAEHITCEPDAILDRWWHDRRLLEAPEDIAAAWKEQGVTHVFLARPGMRAVQEAGFDPFIAQDWQALDAFIEQHLEPLGGSEDLYALYALR